MLILVAIVMNGLILAACVPKGTASARCTPPGVETTEHLHPLRGSLVACLSNAKIKMVAVDKHGLWWLDLNGDHVVTLLPDGGSPVHVTTLDERTWLGMAIDADAIYVPTYDRITRTNLAASSLAQDIVVDQLGITSIAVDDTYIFWTDRGREKTRGSVNRWPKRGGHVEVLAGDQVFPDTLVVDEKNLYWSTASIRVKDRTESNGRFPRKITSRNRVDVASRLMTMPKAGGSVRIVGEAKSKWATDLPDAESIDDPWEEIAHIAVDSTHVYWTTMSPYGGKATIWQTSKAGGTTTAFANLDDVSSLSLTNIHVHVATPNGLFHIRKSGGIPTKTSIEECFTYAFGPKGVYCATSYLTATGAVSSRIELIRDE